MRDIKPTLILRTVVPGRALAAINADEPGSAALAVALLGANGWTVAAHGGRVVADKLDQRRAKALMLRTALTAAGSLAAPLLATTGTVPVQRAEVTTCPF
jgi:hypothetical protein